MKKQGSPSRRLFPLTVLWVADYLLCLWLATQTGIEVEILYFALVLGLGIILTVLVALEWSVFLPGRKMALVSALAGASWWLATALLVHNGYEWRLWHPINSILLMVVTFIIGFWLAGEIERSGHLIPVCIIGTLVDIWSVFLGPSKEVGRQVVEHLEQAQEAVLTGLEAPPPPLGSFFILHWPYPGMNMMTTLFGLGDLVFVAFFLGACRRFGLSLLKGVLPSVGGLFLAVAISFLIQRPVPALPFVCGLFLLGNYKGLSLTPKEWKITLIMAGVILLIGFLSFLSNPG